MFDFNDLSTLYRTQKIDDARIMLYENINVLTTQCGFIIPEDELSDQLWDVFILVDKRINQALNKGYQNQEVYWFLKTRIRWYLMNERKRRDKVEFNDEIMNLMEQLPSKQDTDMKWELEYAYILNYIYDMEEPFRTVLVLKLAIQDPYSMNDIAKYMRLNSYEVSKIYDQWKEIIRSILSTLPDNNEKTTTSKS